jgi:hypothetical protein
MRERFLVDRQDKPAVRRRDVLRAVTTMGVAAVASAAPYRPAVAEAASNRGKRQSRYQANSAEVQTFYRVNRYPAK